MQLDYQPGLLSCVMSLPGTSTSGCPPILPQVKQQVPARFWLTPYLVFLSLKRGDSFSKESQPVVLAAFAIDVYRSSSSTVQRRCGSPIP